MAQVKHYLEMLDYITENRCSSREAARHLKTKYKLKDGVESIHSNYQHWKKRNVLNGTLQRKLVKPKSDFDNLKKLVKKPKSSTNPLNLPESKETAYVPFVLPKECKKILFLSDIHVPYHNIEALTVAIKHGIEHKCDTIYLNGDIIDFYAISFFDKDPRKRNFGDEVLKTREFLTTLRGIFPKAKIYYKCGNHDVRFEKYIMKNAPDLLGLGEYNLETLLHLSDNKITFIPDKQIVHAGKLTMLHGHELGKTVMSPVNVARGLYLRTKESSICGHSHQTSQHVEPSVNGKITSCWSVGCLCELHPEYAPINKYNHGFARIEISEDGTFEVFNYTIINGKVR